MTGGISETATATDYLAAACWEVLTENPAHAGTAADPGAPIADDVTVPTTAAAVVAATAGAAAARDRDYDAETWWFRTTVDVPADHELVLDCGGLATICEIWVDGEQVAESESMFVPLQVPLRPNGTRMAIALRFRSLTEHLRRRRPRGRWRSSMVSAQGLRWVRTSMLGRAPVYTGVPAPVGPWRPVSLVAADAVVAEPRIRTHWADGRAVLHVGATTRPGGQVRVELAHHSATLPADADGTVDATLEFDDLEPWWPHTHGSPTHYTVRISDEHRTTEQSIGFRAVTVDYSDGGFALSVNGLPVFCRGACWVPVDPIGLGDAGLREQLVNLRDAGANMVRVVGSMVYESPEFYALCSELGVLVWQDIMVATIDPPEDESFTALLRAEVEAFLRMAGRHPALAVISGGSETHQQPAMLGLPAEESGIPFSERVLPEMIRRDRLDVVYVPSTPYGGDLATHEGSGVAHYFGIGGYLRPLDDVRAARVRFAAECLAFSVPPEPRSVGTLFGSSSPAGHDPVWKAGVPRDRGSSWDFEDVRDHYVRTLFGVEPSLVRRDDPDRYLDLGRAAVCEAVTAAYSYWRAADSDCAGALMLALRDTGPGAGWGLVDALGVPKASWYAWARAAAPTAVLLEDRGLDGVHITVHHDGPRAVNGVLRVALHTMTGLVPVEAATEISIPAHGRWSGTVDGVIGHFTDASHSHRFGRRSYEAIVVHLDSNDLEIGPAVHLVGGPDRPVQDSVGMSATCERRGDDWFLTVATVGAAQYVATDLAGFRPADSWFHLAPGMSRTVRLIPIWDAARPSGRVRALNSMTEVPIEVRE